VKWVIPTSVSIQPGVAGSTGAVAGGNGKDVLQQNAVKGSNAAAFGSILQQQVATDGTQGATVAGNGSNELMESLLGSDGKDPLAELLAGLQLNATKGQSDPNDPTAGQSDLQALLASLGAMTQVQTQTPVSELAKAPDSTAQNKLLLGAANQMLQALQNGSPVIQQMIVNDGELKKHARPTSTSDGDANADCPRKRGGED